MASSDRKSIQKAPKITDHYVQRVVYDSERKKDGECPRFIVNEWVVKPLLLTCFQQKISGDKEDCSIQNISFHLNQKIECPRIFHS